ncbi:uncharacterized protein METZ01_LOCUS371022, partial [marine metagenome]
RSSHQNVIAEAKDSVAKSRTAVAEARQELGAAEAAREAAVADELISRDTLQADDAKLSRLHADAEALTELLGHGESGQGPGIVDSLDVEPGYEAALGAALGDDLEAPENLEAAIHWTSLRPLDENPSLPENVEPLADFVRGPASLARRLAQVGVVESGGAEMQNTLRPGQRLVAKDGAMWRWDGFTVNAGAPTAAASRLKQRNRLIELERDMPAANHIRRKAEKNFQAARDLLQDAAKQATSARNNSENAEEALNQARDRLAELVGEAVAENSRLTALAAVAERLGDELTETASAVEETRKILG